MVSVIKAEQNHIAAIAALEKECFSEPWSYESIRAEFDNGAALFVALVDEEIAGFIGMQWIFDEGYIHNVAVRPAFRRQGIARKMLEVLLGYADQNEIFKIALDVRASNIPAIALYKSAGFVIAAKRHGVYIKPQDDGFTMIRTWKDRLQ